MGLSRFFVAFGAEINGNKSYRARSEATLGEVFRGFGQSLISMNRPCPPNLPHSAVRVIMSGRGLSAKNKPCPKYPQTVPNNLYDRDDGGCDVIRSGRESRGKMCPCDRYRDGRLGEAHDYYTGSGSWSTGARATAVRTAAKKDSIRILSIR